MRPVFLVIVVLFAGLCPLANARACPSLVPADQEVGETDEHRIARGKAEFQDGLRARSDAVFLAQVSAARMVSPNDAVFTLTPLTPLYEAPEPSDPVTVQASLFVTCGVQPTLGSYMVVYAKAEAQGWRVIDLVLPADIQNPPPALARVMRDTARGLRPGPDYSFSPPTQ